eukprot:1136525-Pyramimonas_sp.AAC.2
MGAQQQNAGQRDAKTSKTKDNDDAVSKNMLVQLEARMRAQEHITQKQVHLPTGSPARDSMPDPVPVANRSGQERGPAASARAT